ncbi:hypothetical protein WICANDRAFT_82349 [Wickerhamomyces anomalus NRRL Y-366-8]|uniref:Major facilitator superfamily (MFS) profile domain-containing protein n=1 Tax=Wickerhamomyces anomalus (strain ATCC 58044 / CBS 1984 / NCYC 433 / NRRL Y-366-8) TaxID=683960 RepID=A0A1E3PA32_WICAA|nr:uncharacterized protein WICANDRAFT_82349 [Wickerhamomyces anomalus NRRL Y-366-8]ODQ62275.1 hypothetical protein WICANDRAFT_82349 [Wickerhamomyces anomalus NRRL Y-366-8]
MSSAKILIRGSLLGRFIYRVSSRKYLGYKEESKDYVIPEKYLEPYQKPEIDSSDESTLTLDKSKFIIVDWDGDDDPDHPNNWPIWIRIFVGLFISTLSAFVYMASAVYLPAIEELQDEFHIGHVVATLPLSLFVIAYGLGPLIFSPLSEHPSIGRNSLYVITLVIFAILQIPTALAKDIASFCVLRFIGGIFASPALATGAATFADMYSLPYMPVGLALWGIGSFSGVSLGPLIGSALEVSTHGWRWSFWFMLILSSFLALAFATIIPETYHQTILAGKAERLRRITGNPHIVLESDLHTHDKSPSEVLTEILWRSVEIGLREPVVVMINLYIALLYAVMYLWFEGFPIYFAETKHFSTMATGVAYVSIIVGVALGAFLYIFLIFQDYTKPMLRKEKVHPEAFMRASIIGSIILPIGLFIFGWSATRDHHWIGAIIGAAIYGFAGIMMFQTLLNYIGMSFHRYVASAFASNAFLRSVVAGCFPLFGRAMFKNLSTSQFPVAWGSTILGIITIMMISVPVLFYLKGPKLRASSKYSGTGREGGNL